MGTLPMDLRYAASSRSYSTNISTKRSALQLDHEKSASLLAFIDGVPPIRAEYSTHGQDAHATVLRTALTGRMPVLRVLGTAPMGCIPVLCWAQLMPPAPVE